VGRRAASATAAGEPTSCIALGAAARIPARRIRVLHLEPVRRSAGAVKAESLVNLYGNDVSAVTIDELVVAVLDILGKVVRSQLH